MPLRAASDLERRVQRIADGWEAELRIALDAIIPSERLFPLLQAFYAAGHSTQIRITGEVLGGTWDALATGRADLAIGAPADAFEQRDAQLVLQLAHGVRQRGGHAMQRAGGGGEAAVTVDGIEYLQQVEGDFHVN